MSDVVLVPTVRGKTRHNLSVVLGNLDGFGSLSFDDDFQPVLCSLYLMGNAVIVLSQLSESRVPATDHATALEAVAHLCDVFAQDLGKLGVLGFGNGHVAILGQSYLSDNVGMLVEEGMDVLA